MAFGRFLLGSVKRLAEFPVLGRIVPEFDEPSIREIVVRNYRVIYLLNEEDCRVDVVRFWHGARGIPEIEK